MTQATEKDKKGNDMNAYLDGSTGAAIAGLFAAGFAGLGAFFRLAKSRVRARIRRNRPDKGEVRE